MTLDLLGRLEAAHEALIAALDGNDVGALEQSVERLHTAILAVRAQGGWRELQGIKERVLRIVQLAEAARVRVNFLTDLTNERLQMLAAARGEASAAPYRRHLRQVA